jgi:hypothetical protein
METMGGSEVRTSFGPRNGWERTSPPRSGGADGEGGVAGFEEFGDVGAVELFLEGGCGVVFGLLIYALIDVPANVFIAVGGGGLIALGGPGDPFFVGAHDDGEQFGAAVGETAHRRRV